MIADHSGRRTAKEVVVLGAGMAGVGAALALRARGFQVLLLDRSQPGSETSYGNAGFIQGEAVEPYALPRDAGSLWRIAMKVSNAVDWDLRGLWKQRSSLLAYWRASSAKGHARASRWYAPLIRRATRDHERLIKDSGSQQLVRREGYRLIFRRERALEQQALIAERWRATHGVRFDLEDGAALARAEPALQVALAGAIRWHDTWTCSDPAALVRAYAALFVRAGGELRTAELTGLVPTGSGWTVTTSAGPIGIANVVVALGPWSPRVLEPLDYQIPMVAKRGYHANVQYPAAGAQPSGSRLDLALIDADLGAVYAPMRAGLRIATGADLSAGRAAAEPRQLARALVAARELLDIGPAFESAAWSGIRPCMPDMLPVVGAAPRHPGLWFNFGHGHQGFTLGPTTGALLADVMAGEGSEEGSPLSPSRLARM